MLPRSKPTERNFELIKNWDNNKYPDIDFYDIQKLIIVENKERFGIFLGTGVGKTLPTTILAEGRTLVICHKQGMLDKTWENNNEKFKLGKDITVINYDMFWRKWEEYYAFDTVILDEGHRALGVQPYTRQRNRTEIPMMSKTFEAIYNFLLCSPPKRLYVVTATPVSKPFNIWAIAKLYGVNWDFYQFRSTFYFLTMMGRRHIWLPKNDEATQERLRGLINRFGYTGALSDFMDVPEQKHLRPDGDEPEIEYIELSDEQKKAIKKLNEEEADPLIRRSRMRTIENGILYGKKLEAISEKEDKMVKDTQYFKNGKIDYILERALEFPKMFIFASYTAQVFAIAEALRAEGYNVVTVTGATKDRANVFHDAERADKVVLVVQAMICEGYRVPSVPCMIFASKSNRFLHYSQGLGRILDGQHLKKNLYIHLVVKGGADEACHKAIMNMEDFQEKLSVI